MNVSKRSVFLWSVFLGTLILALGYYAVAKYREHGGKRFSAAAQSEFRNIIGMSGSMALTPENIRSAAQSHVPIGASTDRIRTFIRENNLYVKSDLLQTNGTDIEGVIICKFIRNQGIWTTEAYIVFWVESNKVSHITTSFAPFR